MERATNFDIPDDKGMLIVKDAEIRRLQAVVVGLEAKVKHTEESLNTQRSEYVRLQNSWSRLNIESCKQEDKCARLQKIVDLWLAGEMEAER